MTVDIKTLSSIYSDPEFKENCLWGSSRPGHSEGTILAHINELTWNLRCLGKTQNISVEQSDKLYFLIMVHDLFKGKATPKVPITDPTSHASLAKHYATKFTDDQDILNMIQYHDEGFALWRKYKDVEVIPLNSRLFDLIHLIEDMDLFLMFNIIDNCTEGKDKTPLYWFVDYVHAYLGTNVNPTWITKLEEEKGTNDKKSK